MMHTLVFKAKREDSIVRVTYIWRNPRREKNIEKPSIYSVYLDQPKKRLDA